jgi:pyridoxamine 5'-phosphate oxidase-like protein
MTPLPSSTYVSLTTFRRTGALVSTPVWAAPDDDSLVVWTSTDSGRRTPGPHRSQARVGTLQGAHVRTGGRRRR